MSFCCCYQWLLRFTTVPTRQSAELFIWSLAFLSTEFALRQALQHRENTMVPCPNVIQIELIAPVNFTFSLRAANGMLSFTLIQWPHKQSNQAMDIPPKIRWNKTRVQFLALDLVEPIRNLYSLSATPHNVVVVFARDHQYSSIVKLNFAAFFFYFPACVRHSLGLSDSVWAVREIRVWHTPKPVIHWKI